MKHLRPEVKFLVAMYLKFKEYPKVGGTIMSNLMNISKWSSIALEAYFTEKEVERAEENEIGIFYDPIDKDYIAESFGMPTYFNEDIDEVIEFIKSEDFLI